MARDGWSDGRLDEFKESVNRRFDEVDRRFEEVDKRFDQVDKRFDRIEGDIREMRGTLAALQRAMVQGTIGICGIMVTGFGTLIGLQVF